MERRVRVVATGLLLGMLGCVAGPAGGRLSPGPRVVVEEAVYDFGDVPIGESVHHSFVVTNRGSQPLTLQPGRSECACHATVISGSTLAAGETGRVEVAFDTNGAPGARVRTVAIETNDPESREVVFALRGNVVADVTSTPSRVFFGRVAQGTTHEIDVDVETGRGVRVRRVTKASPRFDVEAERLPASRPGIRLHVRLRPQERPGPFDDAIVVETDSTRQPSLEIPVLGDVR